MFGCPPGRMGVTMVRLEIEGNHAGQRLDKFLGKYLPEAPVSFLYKMLRKKNITLNGKRAEGRELLRVGDQVALWLADETILKFGGYLPQEDASVNQPLSAGQTGQEQVGPKQTSHIDGTEGEVVLYHQAYRRLQGISVIYEDSHVLILNKPAGVLTQQANAGDLSLNEWMIGYLLDTGALSDRELRLFRPSVCNRLDRNTSGLVLCGKSLPGSQALSELIRSRAVRKFYRTVCLGVPETEQPGDAMEIQGYLYKNARTNQVVIRQQEPGEHIRTVYRPMQRYSIARNSLSERTSAEQLPKSGNAGTSQEADTVLLTELEVELITGKTHQIRAHLASIGHPLVGDHKYGNPDVNQLFRRRFGLRWQLLHAHRLQFPELDGVLAPLGGRSIFAPLPTYYESIAAEMRAEDK